MTPHRREPIKRNPKPKKPKAIKFIVTYLHDRGDWTDEMHIYEGFTNKDVIGKIEELALDSSVRRESIKVYEIKRARKVKLGVKVTFEE